MPNPRLASRYAKALIQLAIERGELETVFADMQWLQSVCKSNPDFVNVLRSPIIKGDQKNKIITAVTTGRISELTASFNKLLINKTRESDLPEIAVAFIQQYKEHKNIHTVKLTTSSPVSEAMKNEIMNRIRSTSNMQNIELETSVNEELIGGFVLQAGDKLVDASVAYDLKQISRQFENNDFIYKIR
jgi:F-type H+-transporting ATPase subunit delta